jgi:TRAP-type mannitol/chloroaromatic compound transport system substrate-binding protein
VLNACRVVNQDMLAEYTARNNAALQTLVNEHQVDVRRLPDTVLERLRALSGEVVSEIAGGDPLSGKVYDSFSRFRSQVEAWHDVSERAYFNVRGERT